MDVELVVLALAGTAALSGAIGVVWGRGTLDEGWPAPSMQLETVDSGTTSLHVYDVGAHEHAATTFDSSGWACDCGQHYHSFMFAIKGSDEMRCVCGKTGTGKEWA